MITLPRTNNSNSQKHKSRTLGSDGFRKQHYGWGVRVYKLCFCKNNKRMMIISALSLVLYGTWYFVCNSKNSARWNLDFEKSRVELEFPFPFRATKTCSDRSPYCFHPGSNWGSFACEANGLTNFPMKACKFG